MKNNFKISLLFLTLGLILNTGCKTNPNKIDSIDTKIDHRTQLNDETSIGVKDGNAVFQKKVELNEELRKIQYEVYETEDRVYGNRRYGSLGLYGVLRDCKVQLSDPKNGGDGKLAWTEPLERITDKEDEFKIGIDEKNKLVAVTEEFLVDRIQRFRGYKSLLNKRQDEYEEKVSICKADLKSRQSRAVNN